MLSGGLDAGKENIRAAQACEGERRAVDHDCRKPPSPFVRVRPPEGARDLLPAATIIDRPQTVPSHDALGGQGVHLVVVHSVRRCAASRFFHHFASLPVGDASASRSPSRWAVSKWDPH
ncbi:hypothetical protein GCM10010191_61530 [Actinomadura vinacea]|uniref:Uncharacterized protein n=1 Tax=Actinomadura vinacea TaxID=115336 RepID=A0ABN3JRT8_9ACTN